MASGKSEPDPIDVLVGARVRQRRKLKGLSQTSLGEAIGVTFQQVQKYERGTNRVSASKLAQIARKLECSVAELHGEDGQSSCAGLNVPGGPELLDAYTKLDARMQQALLGLVKAQVESLKH